MRSSLGKHSHSHTHTYLVQLKFIVSPPCSFRSSISLSFLIAPPLPTSTSEAWEPSHPMGDRPASSTSPWPSPLRGLPHPVGPQRLASPTHPPRQRLGSPLVCRKSRAAATSRTTRLASRSLKCFRFWIWARMEPGEQRGHTGMLFQPLRGITSQKPSFYKFEVGT